ncbi:MAG: hypothetical protein GQ542_03325 [Desulforhopalus sp.]|jgi:hypothetical protein|nr:hypothetical protein [Desulforhopalus sp.]
MTEEIVKYLSSAEAAKLVGAIQEEEDIEQTNRRLLTVYSKDDKELCWFDFEEVKSAVGDVPAGERKEAVHNYIINHIPDWVNDL